MSRTEPMLIGVERRIATHLPLRRDTERRANKAVFARLYQQRSRALGICARLGRSRFLCGRYDCVTKPAFDNLFARHAVTFTAADLRYSAVVTACAAGARRVKVGIAGALGGQTCTEREGRGRGNIPLRTDIDGDLGVRFDGNRDASFEHLGQTDRASENRDANVASIGKDFGD